MAFEWSICKKPKRVKPKSREQVLDEMLQPITWHCSSSIASRQNLVTRLRGNVCIVLPFLTKSERRRARKWLKDEAHDGLWD